MLLELAIADAVGFGFEFSPTEFVTMHNDGTSYVQHPNRPNIVPGVYSDDTQMSMALAEWMLSDKPATAWHLAFFFLRAFKRDPREGYAGRFYDLLCKAQSPDDFLRTIQPQSDRAGGAMRATPCGLLATMEECRDMAVWQASLTHATKPGMDAAAASALLTFACRQGCDPGYLPSFLNDTVPGYRWDELWEGPVGNIGIEAVKAALTALVDGSSLSDILVRSVAFTGDVDTVAAIAVGAASLHPGIPSDLHTDLYQGLENGKYGFSYLKRLDASLLKKFPLPVVPDDEEVGTNEPEGAPNENPILDLFGE